MKTTTKLLILIGLFILLACERCMECTVSTDERVFHTTHCDGNDPDAIEQVFREKQINVVSVNCRKL